jgi:hypothetical protein
MKWMRAVKEFLGGPTGVPRWIYLFVIGALLGVNIASNRQLRRDRDDFRTLTSEMEQLEAADAQLKGADSLLEEAATRLQQDDDQLEKREHTHDHGGKFIGDVPIKPCVQGGDLGPGEMCFMHIGSPTAKPK